MEIETARILLATMMTAVPTIMSFAFIALFAFPRSRENWIRKRHKNYYVILLIFVFILVGVSSVSVLYNYSSLIAIDTIFESGEFSQIIPGLLLSLFSLIAIPIYLLIHLNILLYLERQR